MDIPSQFRHKQNVSVRCGVYVPIKWVLLWFKARKYHCISEYINVTFQLFFLEANSDNRLYFYNSGLIGKEVNEFDKEKHFWTLQEYSVYQFTEYLY